MWKTQFHEKFRTYTSYMVCYEGQPFAANYNPSYEEGGLKGHTGSDWACGFGTPIYSPFDGYVYKILTKENPSSDGSGFTGVFMLVDDGIESFEYLIGHCDPTAQVGTQIKKGDQIATEANHGLVYSGNTQITLAMQTAGDLRGSHRHEQKRPYQKVATLDGVGLSIEGGGMCTYQGFYYQVFDYTNGFNGCVDIDKAVFQRDLWIGAEGYDVYVLQRILASKGFLTVPPTGYYGRYTAAAVSAYQKASGISPILGYFGPKTRSSIVLPLIPSNPLQS